MSRIAHITYAQGLVAAELLADGAGNREIADRLGIVEDTVKCHIKALLGAAGCHTRTEFAVRVLRGQIRLTGEPVERPLCAEAGALWGGVA